MSDEEEVGNSVCAFIYTVYIQYIYCLFVYLCVRVFGKVGRERGRERKSARVRGHKTHGGIKCVDGSGE